MGASASKDLTRRCYVALSHTGEFGPRGYLASTNGYGTPLHIADQGEYAHHYAAPSNWCGYTAGWPVFDSLPDARAYAATQPRGRVAFCVAIHVVQMIGESNPFAQSLFVGPWVAEEKEQ
jgi:hypothetical protein